MSVQDAGVDPGTEGAAAVGPPLVVLGLGVVSVLASVALLVAGTFRAHVAGYLLGGVLPILLVGIFRRLDLARRRSPYYAPVSWVRVAVLGVAAAGVLVAALHVWPIATELAR